MAKNSPVRAIAKKMAAEMHAYSNKLVANAYVGESGEGSTEEKLANALWALNECRRVAWAMSEAADRYQQSLSGGQSEVVGFTEKLKLLKTA